MKNCTLEFLDQDGNVSAIYTETKNKVGEDQAVKAYIQEMMPVAAQVKFSKDAPDPKVERLKKTKMDMEKKKKFKGVKSSLDELGGEMPPKVVRYVALQLKAWDFHNSAKKIDPQSAEFKEAMKKAREYFEVDSESQATKNKVEFDQLQADVLALWKKQQEMGTYEHEFLEFVIDEWMKLSPDQRVKFHRKQVIDKAVDRYKKTSKGYSKGSDGKMITNSILNALQDVAYDLLIEIGNLEGKYGKLEAFPEQDLFSEKVKINGHNAYGIADLILMTKDGRAIIVDYKTKSPSSFHSFDNIAIEKMKGPFSELPSNGESHVALQLGIYKKILSEEFGIETLDTKVLLITGEFAHSEKDPPGGKDWKLVHIDKSKTEIRHVDTPDGLIEDVASGEYYERNRVKIDGIMNEVYDGVFDPAAGNVEGYVERQLATVKMVKGKFVWYEPFTRIGIKKDSIEDIKKEMRRTYKEFKTKRKNATTDLALMFKKDLKPIKGSVWSQLKGLYGIIKVILKRHNKYLMAFTQNTMISLPLQNSKS